MSESPGITCVLSLRDRKLREYIEKENSRYSHIAGYGTPRNTNSFVCVDNDGHVYAVKGWKLEHSFDTHVDGFVPVAGRRLATVDEMGGGEWREFLVSEGWWW